MATDRDPLLLSADRYVAFLLVGNFLKRKNWQEEALTVIVLLPFLLRLLRLK